MSQSPQSGTKSSQTLSVLPTIYCTVHVNIQRFQFCLNRDSILLAGRQEGHPAYKKLGVGLLAVMICLRHLTSYSSSCHQHLHHIILSSNKIKNVVVVVISCDKHFKMTSLSSVIHCKYRTQGPALQPKYKFGLVERGLQIVQGS